MGKWEQKDEGAAVPAEIKKKLDEIMRAFEAYKAKNDQDLAEVKRRGSTDVVTKTEVGKINSALDGLTDEVKKLWKKANRPAITAVGAEASREVKADAEFGLWSGSSDEAKNAAGRREYKAALNTYLRRGDKALSQDEQKALSVGSAPDGGFFVEPARADRIITRVFETSAMRAVASAVTVGSSSVKMPIDRDEAGYEWVGEVTSPSTTTTPRVGELEIPVHELSAMPKVTQSLLDDAQIDVEAWLGGKVSDRFARGENTAFVLGDGVKKPKGFLTYATATTDDATRAFGTLQYVASGASGAFASSNPGDALVNLVYALKAAYRANARFVMNRSTQGAVRKLKDGQGNYLWQPSFQQGQPSTLSGFGVEEFQDMPDIAASSLSIGFGDFRSGYLIVDRSGLRQLRDPFTAKPYVLFYTTKRVGGAVVDSDAIKLMKFATS